MGFRTIRIQFVIIALLASAFSAKAQCGAVISTFPYNESFESAPAWTAGGTNSDWAWGTPAHATISSAGSGIKCWTVGGLTGSFYNYSEQSWIMSPCFDFSSLNYPWISFKIFWEDEWRYDGMVLQYSLNSGATWSNVGAYGDAVNCLNANWYNYNNVSWLTSGTPKHGWTGRAGATSGSCQGGNGSLGWVTAKHCMSSLAGQPNVRFRFLFGSGTTCNNYDGISIDDIFIDNAAPNVANFTYSCVSANTLAFTSTSGMCPTSFTWNFNDPLSGSNNTSTLANPTHIFSNYGTYNVSLTTSGPCNAPSTIVIPVHILGLSTLVQYPSCFGMMDGYLTAYVGGGVAPYTYLWSTGDTTQSITGLGGGIYSLTVTSGTSCPISNSYTFINPPPLTVSTTATAVSCYGGSNGTASATASGGTSSYGYVWTPSGGSGSIVSGLTAGTYTVTVSDGNGCSSTASATVTQPASPLLVSASAIPVSCFGGSNGTATSISSGGTSPYNYSWAPSGGSAAAASGLPSGNYTVILTDANGCTSSSAVTVTQPTPISAVTSTTPALCTTYNGTGTVNASGGTSPYTYLWSPYGGSSASASGLAQGTYTVTITDGNGCIYSPALTIGNSGSITANINSTPINCYSGTNGTASVTITGGTSPYSYSWNNGQTGPSITNLNAGNYCVSVTDANGCADSNCVNIINPPPVIVDFTSDPWVTDMSHPEINFTNQSPGTITWQWNFGDTITSSTENPSHTFPSEGTYPVTLIVSNSMGCIDSVTHNIIINDGFTFYAPNAFTPNDNGNNDIFLPKGSDWDPARFNLWIYDRWGNMIFHTTDMNQGWNGKVKGAMAEIDVYVWKVSLAEITGKKHNYFGSVTIVK